MPLGGLDLVTVLSHHAVNVGLAGSHEGRLGGAHLGSALVLSERTAVHRHFEGHARFVQLSDRDQTILGGKAGVGGYTRVGGPDLFAEPVVVHLIDLVDQDEPGLGEIVGGGHDHVPHPSGTQMLVDLAGYAAFVVCNVAFLRRPLPPGDLIGIGKINPLAFRLLGGQRKGERPPVVPLYRFHELLRNQQGKIELPQPAVFALGADEVEHVGMTNVEGRHLRAAPAAGRGHRETHAVVDVHERQGPGGIGAGAGDVGTARAQRGKLVADAATRLQGQPRLVNLLQDPVHGVAHRARDGAVDGGGRGLVGQRTRIGDDASRRDGALAKGPQKSLAPLVAFVGGLDLRQCTGDPTVGLIDGLVDDGSVLFLEPVLLVPDVLRSRLEGDFGDGGVFRWNLRGFHCHRWDPLLVGSLCYCLGSLALPARRRAVGFLASTRFTCVIAQDVVYGGLR